MGYCMDLVDSDFVIPADNAQGALDAIKALDPNQGRGGRCGPDGWSERWFSWVVTEEFKNAETLSAAFQAWRWALLREDSGDHHISYFNGEKLGDDDVLFRAVAPFVAADSWIEMLGEDGERWRWVFDGTECRKVYAEIVWR